MNDAGDRLIRGDMPSRARQDPAEELIWQALALTRGIWTVMDDLELTRSKEEARPLIGVLNDIDERLFFALFAVVPGMYGESEDDAIERDRRFNERYGELPGQIARAGVPRERILQLFVEIRRRIGSATIHLDTRDDEGAVAGIEELEVALEAIASARATLDEIAPPA